MSKALALAYGLIHCGNLIFICRKTVIFVSLSFSFLFNPIELPVFVHQPYTRNF